VKSLFKWLAFKKAVIPSAKLIAIYTCSNGGEAMQSCQQLEAIKDRGLRGDRYFEKTGFWHPVESCQATLISEDDLLRAEKRGKISMGEGIHRRNLLISGLKTKDLKGKEFRIGNALFAYEKPRPPCAYIDTVAEKGVARALSYHSGICIRVIESGIIHIEDSLTITTDLS
jgi:MOSC domain-containing protein YiiM